jgi:hypothetical protein
MNKEAESLKQRLRDQTNSNENLEQELNDVQKRKMEQEISWKEERSELERQLNDLKHNLSKLQNDNEESVKKLNLVTENYKEAYKDNELILRDFDEFKRHQGQILSQKDSEINSLRSETY